MHAASRQKMHHRGKDAFAVHVRTVSVDESLYIVYDRLLALLFRLAGCRQPLVQAGVLADAVASAPFRRTASRESFPTASRAARVFAARRSGWSPRNAGR